MAWDANVESPLHKSETSSATGKKSSSVKDAAEKYFSYATAHGYAHIWGETGYVRRLVWVILCLILTAYTIYQIGLVISDYATFPKKISRNTGEDRKWVTFPGVTICTLSPLPRTDDLKAHPLWGTFIQVEENFNSTKCTADKKDGPSESTSTPASRRKRSGNEMFQLDDPSLEGFDGFTWPVETTVRPDHYEEKMRRVKRQDIMDGYSTTMSPLNSTGNCTGFECPEGNCIPMSYVCDQYNDCAAGADESNCSECNNEQFQCFDGKCIPLSWKCDNITDCAQAEDEYICAEDQQNFECPFGNRTCGNGACLRDIYFCDGIEDCQGGDDEKNCDTCSGRSFRCSDGQCIPSHYVCDGTSHCTDLEDESSCTVNATSCPEDYYVCQEDKKCLNPRFLCNKAKDCRRGDDEDGELCKGHVTASPAHRVRLKCSKIYNDTIFMATGIQGDDTSLVNTSCDIRDGEFIQEIGFSPMCVMGIVCDYFGCYNIKGKYYSDYTKNNGILCALCSGTETCWAQFWISQWTQGLLALDSLRLMLSKEKSDFNDLTNLFIPTEEEKANYSISTKEFIYSCKFDGYPCEDSYFKQWPSDGMGSCYSFNSPLDGYSDPYLATGVGPMHGLEITLNVRTGMAILSKEVGVSVSIHNPKVLPVPLEESFNVGPGTSSIRLSRTKYVHLGNPHGNCSSQYKNGAPFEEYSRSICKALCLEARIRELCNCTKSFSPIYSNMTIVPEKPCSALSLEDEVCLERVHYEFTYENIDCKCYQPCNEMTYLPKVTTSKVNDYYFNLLHQYRKKVSSLCSKDTHLLTLNVYIDSPYYEIIEETPAYTFDTLLSNIGGSLGLFIGVSIISIVEVIEFIVDICLTSIRTRRGRIRGAVDGEGQSTVMYPDDICRGCVSPEALQRLKREVAKETEQDIEALRREMAQEKERDRAQLEKEMALQKEELTKEMARVRQMSEKDLEAYLDASVDRIIGVGSEKKSKDGSADWAKQTFNALFLKR